MKEENFTKILGEIDENYVAEVFEEAKTKRIVPFKKWVAIAACACLLIASATVVIAEVFDISVSIFDYHRNDMTGNYTTEGYKLNYEIDYYSPDSFGPMEELKEGIDREGKRIMHVSELPPEEQENFIEFYGAEYAEIDVLGEHSYYEVYENPEEAFESIGTGIFEFPDFGLNHKSAEVYLTGYSSEELTGLRLDLVDKYIVSELEPNIVLGYSAYVQFAETVWGDSIPFVGGEGDTFSEEHYTNENGIEYLVIKMMNSEGKIKRIESFLIKDNILYNAYMIDYSGTEDLKEYEDFIHNWANFY